MARFETKRKDGTWGDARSITETMRTARLRILPGAVGCETGTPGVSPGIPVLQGGE